MSFRAFGGLHDSSSPSPAGISFKPGGRGDFRTSLLLVVSAKRIDPTFLQATPEGPSIRARLSHAEGLTAKSQTIGGFEVAGENHKFAPAIGKIEGNTILVSTP
jgi:hypothetical protein